MDEDNRIEETEGPRSRPITDLSPVEARGFFLKGGNYSRIQLPRYFHFDELLADVAVGPLARIPLSMARDCDDVNYILMSNKNGEYAWRPMSLVHPVLYVSLVDALTEPGNWGKALKAFEGFRVPRLECMSIPVESLTKQQNTAEQISRWWQDIEQKSIALALDYNFLFRTDITDCYPSIYTHSIAWALHGKENAKKKRNRNNDQMIGNVIDWRLQDMHNGQTNGIPQGAEVMDFIAEMVLGYADVRLHERISTLDIGAMDYHILRYRDDYRIFVNTLSDGELILKHLNEVMIDMGLKLNSAKTNHSSKLIQESVKRDKLAWIFRKQSGNVQNQLLAIHDHGMEFPNAGSVERALTRYHKRLYRRWENKAKLKNVHSLISIIVDIAYHSPRTYRIAASILSILLDFIDGEQAKMSVIEKIVKKFERIPNTGYLDLWLQRISFSFDKNYEFKEGLCKVIQGNSTGIWNNEWLKIKRVKSAVDRPKVIDRECLANLPPVVPPEEVELYIPDDEGYAS